MITQLDRVVMATMLVLVYAALCMATLMKQRRRQQQRLMEATSLQSSQPQDNSLLIAFASQTGTAELLAWQSARTLHAAGLSCRVMPLMQLNVEQLTGAQRLLLIASTYGEGDAPDNAALFVRRVMKQSLHLSHLQFSLLALGDRTYRHFCGFGHALRDWLRAQRATEAAFIEVHNGDATALDHWRQQLSHLAGTHDLPVWQEQPFTEWRLLKRELLNPGSAGHPCYALQLRPAEGELPTWQAGDLVQVRVSTSEEGDARPREYSIASLPQEGVLQLLVRRALHDDGTPGVVSGWLTQCAMHDRIELRVRTHAAFHIDDNAGRPLILIGNGTGMAGLRAHLKAREQQGPRCWLIFGERNVATDFFHADEIRSWQAQGVLARVDLAFSRDQPHKRYVQHCLREAAATVREWINDGAAIYVCGSLSGMAVEVHSALCGILGTAQVDELVTQGRYRRDVY